MYYIGIDLGTSSVKLILTDESGNILNKAVKTYPLMISADGCSEQNPNDWLESTLDGITELTDGFERENIAGIGCAGQMHGLVILDVNDNVIRPAILWNDGRSAKEVDYLNKVIGREKIIEYTSNIAFAGFTAPKLLWLRQNEPKNFERICKIMLSKDYIVYSLSGAFSTDASDASGTLLMNVKKRRWSSQMLDICGISEKQLPCIHESFEQVGTLKASLAGGFGFNKNVKIVAGAGDNAAAAVGTGTVGNGAVNISVGTSGTVFASSDRLFDIENNAIHAFGHADGAYHYMGCILSAALCNEWWCGKILATEDYISEQSNIERLGENRVLFLPYLAGERSPHNNERARGMFIGMSPETSRADITQAVMEGVAFALRDSFEIIKECVTEIKFSTICGGGAKSKLWCEIISNVLNIKLYKPIIDEGPSFGAAVLAMVGCGVYESVNKAVKNTVTVTEYTVPKKELVEKYNGKYVEYKRLYPAVKQLFG